MLRTGTLLRLYPKAWRERYGDEFIELMGSQPVGFRQKFDIVMGAIDAHVAWSPVAKSANVSNQEDRIMVGLRTVCATKPAPMTTRDGMIAAAIYLLFTIAAVAAGSLFKRNDMDWASDLVLGMSFPVATLAMLPMFMKGQPFRVQAVVIGSTFSILMLIAYITAVAL